MTLYSGRLGPVTKIRGLWRRLRAFTHATSANVAMMFALSLLPLAVAAGAGLDFAHAMMAKNDMEDALDAAALAVGAKPGLTQADAKTLAQNVFNANYKGTGSPNVTPTINGQSVSVTASDSVATTLLAVIGKPTLDVTLTSIVVWGQTKLWVSLVLDNTGSMTETDSSHTSKISALKNASHQLLAKLHSAAVHDGDVQVAIVPFAKDVNIGTGYANAAWIDWSDWNTQAPGAVPGPSVGPGSSCPLTLGCVSGPGSTSSVSNVPSSGMICPNAVSGSTTGQTGHYYDGCYSSVGTTSTSNVTVSSGKNASCNGYSNCTCTGTGKSTVCTQPTTTVGAPYTHTWIVNSQSTWGGCVMDRNQDDDTTDTTPGNKFPAENDQSCAVATLMPLSYDWTGLDAKIDTMVANGGTNQTIGLAHGMQLQTPGDPYNAPALPANTTRYIILLSDGLNTMDRWYGDGSNQSTSVDARMAKACANAKAQGFIIYTLFVDLNGTQGNSTALQNCATDSSKYYDLTSSGEIVTAFNDIAQKITNLRVSH